MNSVRSGCLSIMPEHVLEHDARAYATYVRTYGLTQIQLLTSESLSSVSRAGGHPDSPVSAAESSVR